MTIDHRIAQHDSANSSGVKHQPVERHPLDALRLGPDRCRLVEYPVRRLAHRPVRDDAGAAGVNERLARAGKPRDQRFDRGPVTAVRRIDDAIGIPRLGLQQA
jgi:hypothetical protein